MYNLFKTKIKFIEYHFEALNGDIPDDSLTMIGKAKDILQYCKKKLQWSEHYSAYNHQVFTFNNAKKIKYRYTEENGTEVYSHSFGWQLSSDEDKERLTKKKIETAQENIGTEYIFTGLKRGIL